MTAVKKCFGIVILVVAACVGQAFACTCGGSSQEPPANKAELVRRVLDQADYVFVGKVKGFYYRDDVINQYIEKVRVEKPLLTFETRFAKVQVERWWKGAPDAEVGMMMQETKMSDGSSMSTCEYNFKEGETYLIFARRVKGHLQVDPCAPTRPISVIDLDLLGEGNPPVKLKNLK
jgi:hypothetical protein